MTERSVKECYYPLEAQWVGASHVKAKIRGFQGDNFTIFCVESPKGFREAMHQHPHEQTMYIISGCIRITFPGEPPILVGPGEFIHFPSNKPHEAYVEADMVSIDVFSPAREMLQRPPAKEAVEPR
jgi:quercetin dioxygenase-like cupin family protein